MMPEFKNEEWVYGKSKNGELIHGFVETVDTIQGIIKVTVVNSDNEKVIGKSIWLHNKRTEKLPENLNTESQLLAMIDLALQVKDKQWFMELSDKLISLKKNQEVNTKKYEFLLQRNTIRNINAKR